MENSILKRELIPPGTRELWTTVSSHRMRYLSAGSGTPLLLLHGLMGFSFSWSENLVALADCFTVFAPDLLNSGYSDRCELPADLNSAVQQLLAFMDAVEISSADVMGSSYGGTLAIALAAIAPKRVQRLILVSPSHVASERLTRWQTAIFGNPFGVGAAKMLLPIVPELFFGFFLKRMYGDSSRVLPGTIEEYTRSIKIPGTTEAAAKVLMHWKSNFQVLETLMPKIQNVPTLLIWGDKDPVVPWATAGALQEQLKNSTLRVIPTAGHLPYEELPTEFNRIVLDYCRRPVDFLRFDSAGL